MTLAPVLIAAFVSHLPVSSMISSLKPYPFCPPPSTSLLPTPTPLLLPLPSSAAAVYCTVAILPTLQPCCTAPPVVPLQENLCRPNALHPTPESPVQPFPSYRLPLASNSRSRTLVEPSLASTCPPQLELMTFSRVFAICCFARHGECFLLATVCMC